MKEKTTHILNASSNLLGFCFFVLVSIKSFGFANVTVLDEIVSLSILLFVFSCFLSFLSIRSTDKRSDEYEKYADYVFVVGLASLLIISIAIFFSIV